MQSLAYFEGSKVKLDSHHGLWKSFIKNHLTVSEIFQFENWPQRLFEFEEKKKNHYISQNSNAVDKIINWDRTSNVFKIVFVWINFFKNF